MIKLRHIRFRLLIAFVFLSVVPAVPLSVLFQSMIDKVFSLGFNKSMHTALENGVQISRELLSIAKKRALDGTRQYYENEQVQNLLRKYVSRTLVDSQYQNLYNSRLLLKNKLDGVAIYDASARTVFFKTQVEDARMRKTLTDTAMVKEMLRSNLESVDYRENEQQILTAIPIPLPSQKNGLIVSSCMINPDFAEKSNTILSVLQVYKTFNLERETISHGFLYTFMVIYFIIIILSIMSAIFFSSVMTKPIHSLVLATDQISKGNWDYQVPTDSRKDELGILVDSFNQMIRNIKDQRQRLIFLERMSAWREIAQRVAHEIKNPLTPIQLTIEQIRDNYEGDDDTYKKLLDDCCLIVQEEIQSLRNLTKEFSEFARLPSLNFKSADLQKLLEDLRGMYPNVPLEIRMEHPFVPSVQVDSEAIKRVFINLIDNAIPAIAHRADGKIIIAVNWDEEDVHISVADNGTGIPHENLIRVFEPHFSTKSTGMGLGLAIVKNVIEEHRGSIFVESTENLGTTFFIKLRRKNSLVEGENA